MKRYFVARVSLLARIISDLRREHPGHPPQHRLILGLRGMGKTTLLHRLGVGVEKDDELNKTWLPLIIPEEQYNVTTLTDLWLNTLDALSDRLEIGREEQAARTLDDKISGLPRGRAEPALRLLLDEARSRKKRLLLLIDNIDLVLDRLKKEHWALREVMQSEPDVLILGASANAIEASYQYDAAFYDFFKVHELKGLSIEGMTATLERLAEINRTPHVTTLIQRDPMRIKTLHMLTGGNPRTTMLLFHVLAQGLEGCDVRSDLEGLLDRVTPLYKARFEELPEQAQTLMDALAIHWDPITARQLAERLGWQVNKVSAQLSRLEQQAIVEKTDPVEGKRSAFQISERFFNIWYLMRASRRVRRKLIWLVRFLSAFFTTVELQQHARSYLRESPQRSRDAEYTMVLAQTVAHEPLRVALETQAINSLLDQPQTRNEIHKLLDLRGEDAELLPKVEHIQQMKEARTTICQVLEKQYLEIDADAFCELLLGSPSFKIKEKVSIVKKSAKLKSSQWRDLNKILSEEKKKWQNYFERSINTFYKAIASGDMSSPDDLAGAQAAAERFDEPALLAICWNFCGANRSLSSRVSGEALERSFRNLLKDHPNRFLWNGLGNLLKNHLKRYEEAEQAYREAIAIDPKYKGGYNDLAWFYYQQNRQIDEAIILARKAVKLAPDDLYAIHTLATLLLHQGDWHKAKEWKLNNFDILTRPFPPA